MSHLEKEKLKAQKSQLEELGKLQKCLSQLKQSSLEKVVSITNKSTQTQRGSPAVEVRSVRSQTEDSLPEYRGRAKREGEDGSRGLEARGTQTEATQELEVPPQWLLSEALAGNDHRLSKDSPMGTLTTPLKKNSSEDIIEKISTATQVDLVNTRRKHESTKLQDKTISVLKAKVDALQRDLDFLEDSSRQRVPSERQLITAQSHSVLPVEVAAAGKHGNEDDFSEDSDSTRGHLKETGASMGDVSALEDYVRALSQRLEKMQLSYDQAKQRLSEHEKDLQSKEYTQHVLESCVQKMRAEVEQLSQRLSSSMSGVEQGSLGGKAVNLKTHLMQGRLRDANQQIMAKSRQNQELRSQLEVAENAARNLRARVSRAESANQNKSTLIENYKKQIHELENKVVCNVSHRDSLLAEVRTLKESANGMRKKFAELESELSRGDARAEQWSRAECRLRARVSELVQLLDQKAAQLRGVEGDAISRLQQALQLYQVYIADVEDRVRGAERKAEEFSAALQSFVQAVERPSAEQPQVVCAGSSEAQHIACSILNLTSEQLVSLMAPGSDVTRDQESSKTIENMWKIIKNEDFSEKLSQFLVKIVLENK